MKGLSMHRFPDFDKDVRRPFAVAEDCCDCTEFYHGCPSRLENQLGRCLDFHPLPDVKPGTTGQMVPESKMDGQTVRRVRRELTPDDHGPAHASAPAPARKPRPHHTGPRLCGCGATLPKGKRLCETCRTINRRQTKRGYMRSYMQVRRSESSDVLPDMPLSAPARHATRATAGNLPLTGHPAGVSRSGQTSVLTNLISGGEWK